MRSSRRLALTPANPGHVGAGVSCQYGNRPGSSGPQATCTRSAKSAQSQWRASTVHFPVFVGHAYEILTQVQWPVELLRANPI